MQVITAETANGKVTIESEKGRKLVLAIEDSGIDILHRCGGKRALHDLPRGGTRRRSRADRRSGTCDPGDEDGPR